jgi:L-threonylcarbamoyladenylate synthase
MRISLHQATQALLQGQVVAVPTETVYGLAAPLNNEAAIKQIFALKGRPANNPLIIHIAKTSDIDPFITHLPPDFEVLAQHFWPGPLTLILPIKTDCVLSSVRAGLPTAGFRIPNHPVTLELLTATGPLVMPSANLSGKPSATDPQHVEDDFGLDFPVLEGGKCQKGVESTILCYQYDQWVIVRLGSLAPEVFQAVLGYQPVLVKTEKNQIPLCPGQLFRHYAPRAKLILDGSPPADIPFILGFKERLYPKNARLLILGSIHNPQEVAENLYNTLRQLDHENAALAWIDMEFPRTGLWLTIAERLKRAGEA